MEITEVRVQGYRSVRDLSLKTRQVNVLVGPNGCGKSNLYRALYLLSAAADGRLARTLAEEGGMPSVLWAGGRDKKPVRMTVGVTFDKLSYELSLGLPRSPGSAFVLDAEVKEERLWMLNRGRCVPLMERDNTTVKARDAEGNRVAFPMAVSLSESVFSELREPERFPVLSAVRQELLAWRFYHRFRTDPESPIRQPQVGVRTPILSHDGRDLAAAFQTILEIGDGPVLHAAINEAFPGASLDIEFPAGRFSLGLHMPEFRRRFDALELSDGTLQYLCLLGALRSPRPPALLALNEPETSVHPALHPALARLIARSATDSQLWITTHSHALAEAVCNASGVRPVELRKVDGETAVATSVGDEVTD